MTRLFLEEKAETGSSVCLTGEKAHYLSSVLRCRPDDKLIITDISGRVCSARISAVTKKQVTLEITGQLSQDAESPLEIVLVQGLLKGEKMDLVVQKATELGVREIAPVISERSQIRETRKLQRWQKVAEEASRQCGRSRVPVILEPSPLKSALDAQGQVPGIICWEEGGIPFSSALEHFREKKRLLLCIGPEGGFSEREVRDAEDRGIVTASLGRRILRAETAAIAAVSVAQFVLGDLSGGM